jgi:predicted ATPase/class 3 adenylate cyclase
MSNLPSGTVTFLFTDIEGSTKLWEQHPEAMKAALAKHDSILKEAIEAHHGHIIKTTGDGVHAVFSTAIDAINSTIAAQHDFKSLIANLIIKVRMGLHTGEAEMRENDYYGQTLNRTARIMATGHGGQILLSGITAEVVREHLPANLSLQDLGEHRLKDLIKPEHIFQIATNALPKEFPPLKSLSNFPNNLPTQLTSFIGREKEIEEAEKRLKTARLLTLIGPGGTGKTRLSLQIGADVLPAFADGVWFVELAPLADPALIFQALASGLGIREQMGMSLNEVVINFLRAKNLLLILDNCEHLVDACAQLAEQILQACPNLKIVASSREALGVTGEVVYRVPSLTTLDPSHATLEMLSKSEAVQLFVERATAANPKFSLTEKNASSIAQICRRLDGIPLALELAAARATVLTAEQISSRLDDRFKLLTGGSRTALPRQQTLRALIDWSYDMLSDEERALLRRLSIFAGGWTFEAAEYICPKNDVLDLLSHLVNKSLVIVDEDGETTRYRLLETIRQYARDKLLDTGESVEARNIHAEYFLKLSESVEPHLFKANSLQWINVLEAENDNIRVALEWLIENNVNFAMRIIFALMLFWNRRGYEAEGRVWGETAIAHAESLPPVEGDAAFHRKKALAYTYSVIAGLAISQGDNEYAARVADKSSALAREIGDKDLLARAFVFTISGRIVTGDIQNVDAVIKEMILAANESNDKFSKGIVFGLIAELLMFSGKDEKIIEEYLTKSTAFAKESGNQWGYNMVMLGMGMVAKYKGYYDRSRAGFASILPLFKEMGDAHRVNMIKSEYAHMDRYEGHIEKAEPVYRETIREWQRLGHRAAVANQIECLAFIAIAHEQPERAIKLLGAAEALREFINIDMSHFERIEYESKIKELKENIDEMEFDSLWLEGRSKSMEQAVEMALAEIK